MRVTLLPLLSGCMMEVTVGRNLRPSVDPIRDPIDVDDDGITADEDCDDSDPDTHPGGLEECDGVDNNCDGEVDENKCGRLQDFYQVLQLDALFVIDTSETMTPHLARLADGAGAFLDPLIGTHFDTHIGVITMDASAPDDLGRLVVPDLEGGDPPRFLVGDDPKLVPEFARAWLAKAITDNEVVTGSEPEGRAAADAALRSQPEWNSGFLRPEATLQIVFVSDREDATVSPTLLKFLEHLELPSVKGTLARVSIHPIVQLDDYACDGTLSEETTGASYLSLKESTAGSMLSICEEDYSPWLSAVAQFAATDGLGTRFTLNYPAQTGSVEVTIHYSDEFEQVLDPEMDFALADGNRTVVLLTDPPPPAGTYVRVEYLEQP